MIDLYEMADGYITAALWADCMPLHTEDDDTWESGGLEHLDVSEDDRAYVRRLCRLFVERAGADLVTFAELRAFDPSQGSVSSYIGHDLRLTSGGHGAGFWDREATSYSQIGSVARWRDLTRRLSDLADTEPFSRIGGGDCYQVDADTARLQHYSLKVTA